MQKVCMHHEWIFCKGILHGCTRLVIFILFNDFDMTDSAHAKGHYTEYARVLNIIKSKLDG